MARSNNASSALKALANHSDLIIDAHLNGGNRIVETQDNQRAIETLEAHRLLWRFTGDQDQDPNLKSELVDLLFHVTGAQRRRRANEHVAGLWKDLEGLFSDYREAKQRAAYEDRERLESQIREALTELIDDIKAATETFVSYLNTGFSYVTDIELRVKENQKALDQAHRLNELFDSFRYEQLDQEAAGDPFLKRLLLRYLPAALEEGRRNLSYATNQLRQMLVKMREDQRLSRMLGAFEAHFANNPGFVPDIDDVNLSQCPPAIILAEPFATPAHADIYDPAPDTEAKLIDMAAGARKQPKEPVGSPESESSGPVDNNVEGIFEYEDIDPVEFAAEQMIQSVIDAACSDAGVSALQVWEQSDMGVDSPTWLHTLDTLFDALPANDQQRLRIEYEQFADATFPDNRYVYNIILQPNPQASHP